MNEGAPAPSARAGRGGETAFAAPGTRHNVLVVTRGHAFARDAFYAMFEDNPAIEWSAVEHPAAQLLFTPEHGRHFGCYVLYDMPGIEFRRGGDGVPLVILHHACAAWPSWPLWADIVGARFLYQPMAVRGVARPDSGYRMDVTHTVTPVARHPVTEGVGPFTIDDELYLFQVFEDEVTPLLRSDFTFTQEHFHSASLALAGRMHCNEGWSHPPGSNLVGWVKRYRNSPIVYLQCGDGPAAYAHPAFRRLLANAIDWACAQR